MLPQPSTSRPSGKPRIFFPSSRDPSYSPGQSLFQTLRSRSRLTNLAVTTILSLLSFSLVLNLSFYTGLNSSSRRYHGLPWKVRLKGWEDNATPAQLDTGIPLSIETTVDRSDGRWEDINHLIMVPGHAIWLGSDADNAANDEDWVLEPMQRGGSVKTYIKHIQEGVQRLKKDPKALLVFSGAPPSPLLPEGFSYLSLAHALNLFPTPRDDPTSPISLNLRATAEEFALDSYENLLFSIARFKEMTGGWPTKITVVGYGMKRRRFEMLHRAAIRYPLDRFEYVGIDDEGDTSKHYEGEYGFTPFLASPSGCHPPLSIKRQLRNPYFRYHGYHASCPELTGLLEWCPPIDGSVQDDASGLQVYDGDLPWTNPTKGTFQWGREGY